MHLKRINKHIPADQVDSCYEQLKAIALKPESLDLITNNRAFHRLLLEGVPVEFKKDDSEPVSDHAFLIDFENLANNQFAVVNQFTISGTKQPRRPDVICFINGLPIAVLELKSPSDENADIWDAFNQLQTYKDEVSDLFIFNEALIVSDGYTARVGSLTANQERFMPWRTIKHEDDKPLLEWQLETMVRGSLIESCCLITFAFSYYLKRMALLIRPQASSSKKSRGIINSMQCEKR